MQQGQNFKEMIIMDPNMRKKYCPAKTRQNSIKKEKQRNKQ
jgi:hypothetical protein